MIELADHLGIICIVSTPNGEAPEEIRREWIGVEMSCLFYEENDQSSIGIFTRKPLTPAKVYIVPQEEAISALERTKPEAGRWWREKGFPDEEGALFSFQADSVEEIKPVHSRDQFMELLKKLSLEAAGN